MKISALLKQRFRIGMLVAGLMAGLATSSFGQDVSGFWLGVTYPSDPDDEVFNYTANLTVTGTTIGGTSQTADPDLPFGGVAYVKGQVVGTRVTFKEANQSGNRNDKDICYFDVNVTYNAATESLKGTYTLIYNPPYCKFQEGGTVELYRIRLKSGTTYCKNALATLDVTGQNIRWYDSARKTKLLATGNTYATTLSQSTTLYVTQTVYKTESPAVPIAVNVIDLSISDIKTIPESCGRQGITVTATGGSGLQYSLNNGAFQTSPTFTNLAGGSYTVAVKDAGGCQTTKPVTLVAAKPLQFEKVTVTQPRCGSATGLISVSASGGSGELTVSANSQTSPVGNQVATFTVATFYVPPGTYTLTVKDQTGCTQTQPVSVSAAAPVPVITSVGVTSTSCGQDNGSLAVVVTGGRPPLTYSTDGTTFQPTATFSNLKSGPYTLSVRDADGCSVSESASIGGSAGPRIEQVLVTPATCGLTDGTLQIRAAASPGLSYSRDGRTFQAAPDFVACAPGSYTALVRDAAGCVAQYGVMLRETCGDIIYLPSAFSPNGDGKNDALVIRFPGKSLTVKSFQVFNRWGTLVFALDATTLRSGDALWDAQNLPPQQRAGTYSYTFAVELADGQPFTYRGTLTVISER